MVIKTHIGLFILIAMSYTMLWGLRDDLQRDYEWYVPTLAAFLTTIVVEIFGWVIYYFFFV